MTVAMNYAAEKWKMFRDDVFKRAWLIAAYNTVS